MNQFWSHSMFLILTAFTKAPMPACSGIILHNVGAPKPYLVIEKFLREDAEMERELRARFVTKGPVRPL